MPHYSVFKLGRCDSKNNKRKHLQIVETMQVSGVTYIWAEDTFTCHISCQLMTLKVSLRPIYAYAPKRVLCTLLWTCPEMQLHMLQSWKDQLDKTNLTRVHKSEHVYNSVRALQMTPNSWNSLPCAQRGVKTSEASLICVSNTLVNIADINNS